MAISINLAMFEVNYKKEYFYILPSILLPTVYKSLLMQSGFFFFFASVISFMNYFITFSTLMISFVTIFSHFHGHINNHYSLLTPFNWFAFLTANTMICKFSFLMFCIWN